MGHRYLILDKDHNPAAQADLISKPGDVPWHLEVLSDRVDRVKGLSTLCLIGMGDDDPSMIGDLIRVRGDRIVVQPTKNLGPEARQNLRVPIVFNSVMYPVTGLWKGQRKYTGLDLSCGGVAFQTDRKMRDKEVMELVLPMTDNPLVVKAQILRTLPTEEGIFKYAAKFIDLVEDEDFAIRKAVFSIQIDNQR